MEWTREQRYRSLEKVSQKELSELKAEVDRCQWRQSFHIQPETGLLNDPNGFSFYNGEYHLFYQWFPLGPVHGLKYWYHMKSKDLATWENVGTGIKPDQFFDSHGAYSGSGIEHDDKLYLFYTGNTRDENWVRHPYQCMAWMNKEGVITKANRPIIDHVPEGYTDHFRDPKVWENNDSFYAIIGAQRENKTGAVIVYRSHNLEEWHLLGEVVTQLENFGYMWECPDYFDLDGQGVLMFSPQGLEPSGDAFQNIYQSGYVVGNALELPALNYTHGAFTELDHGFDFYAPQTMEDPAGRRFMVGWMGLPEIAYPTDQSGWAHCLTVPRELTIQNGKLLQTPVKEMAKKRKDHREINDMINSQMKTYHDFEGATYELYCAFDLITAKEVGIVLRCSELEETIIKYDAGNQKVVFDRSNSGEKFAEEYGEIRQCHLSAEKVKFHIFVDRSSVEVFINDGEVAMTARIFPDHESKGIRFFSIDGKSRLEAVKWKY
ncbi:sucrose-6-phosphate hydrolase [Pseudalkalibacillus hwajinpoensis]|uniref:glycoside hydrolase family 32 protein n=1 Tax=Guptibacillus hwajinpoensis TaxID=208199 RepID=UPI00325B445E